MTLPPPTYDLVMLLDPEAEDATRAKLVADARKAIEKQGELLRHDEWGDRALAYPIARKTSAEYHLLQFHVGEPALLSGLDRSLRIADDVLRFRIVKLAPGVPDAPDMRGSAPASRTEGERTQAQPASEPTPAAQEPTPAAAAQEPTPSPAAQEPTPSGEAQATAATPAAPAETASDSPESEPAPSGEAAPEPASGESS